MADYPLYVWNALEILRKAGVVIKQVAGGYYHSLFLTEDGEVWSCGYNGSGQLGRVIATGSATVVNLAKTPGLTGIKGIACGEDHSFFLTEGGEVWSCGRNNYGQLGRAVATGSATVVNLAKIPNLTGIKVIVGGYNYSFFLTDGGDVWSCGYNSYGQLGRVGANGSETAVNLTKTTVLTGVKAVACGQAHSLFLTEGGNVWSCGFNGSGQLGRAEGSGSETSVNLAIISNLSGIEAIACGFNHSLILTAGGEVWSCGQNNSGQLGRAVANGSISNVNLAKIPDLTGIKDIATGYYFSLFLTEDSELFSCGGNSYGQLGRAVADGSATVVNLAKIPGLTGIQAIAGGQAHSLFLVEDSEILSCGYNSNGQLGRAVATGSTTVTNLGKVAFPA
jgi:alpha-tubulin suppressor-like RCC1 family protein